jgi:hypothetical protein
VMCVIAMQIFRLRAHTGDGVRTQEPSLKDTALRDWLSAAGNARR